MWKLAFVLAALAVSASPVDARETSRGRELARDLERISRDLYRDERPEPASSRSSFAAGRDAKKR
jgi:hypothetical protein